MILPSILCYRISMLIENGTNMCPHAVCVGGEHVFRTMNTHQMHLHHLDISRSALPSARATTTLSVRKFFSAAFLLGSYANEWRGIIVLIRQKLCVYLWFDICAEAVCMCHVNGACEWGEGTGCELMAITCRWDRQIWRIFAWKSDR